MRDPSWRPGRQSFAVSYPIRAALRLTEGGKFDPNAASGSSRASFQNFVNLRVVVFALKDKRGIHSPLSKTSIFLLARSLIPATGSLRVQNLVAITTTMIWNHPTTTTRLNNVSR